MKKPLWHSLNRSHKAPWCQWLTLLSVVYKPTRSIAICTCHNPVLDGMLVQCSSSIPSRNPNNSTGHISTPGYRKGDVTLPVFCSTRQYHDPRTRVPDYLYGLCYYIPVLSRVKFAKNLILRQRIQVHYELPVKTSDKIEMRSGLWGFATSVSRTMSRKRSV